MSLDPADRRRVLLEAMKRLNDRLNAADWKGAAEEARYCRAVLIQLESACERQQIQTEKA